jgi:hypothetical protein|tara:strand:+ start:40790 stop:41404 length:615 start_codon:yes stop_codon:yes gene_type:complete
MTIPSSYKRATTGDAAFTAQKVGGVVIGITSATTVTAGSPVTKVFDLKTQGTDGVDRRTAPKDTDITVTALAATGTFAYDQSAFILIGNQANNKINNSASTALVLNGNDATVDGDRASVKPIGAKTLTAFAAQKWMPLGITAQRTNWSVAPTAMNVANFVDPATGSATVVPDGAVGTQAVPGELAYMYGALDANQDEYKERTGG